MEERPIPGLSGYTASDDGHIWSYKAPGHSTPGKRHQLRESMDRQGYPRVTLSTAGKKHGTVRLVHQLVALAWYGPRPAGLEVRHLDGGQLNNRPENLCYGTRAENAADAVRHGTATCLRQHGDAHPSTRLPGAVVAAIRAQRPSLSERRRIAALHGVSDSLLRHILCGAARREG
jgi:hypothetical protein